MVVSTVTMGAVKTAVKHQKVPVLSRSPLPVHSTSHC